MSLWIRYVAVVVLVGNAFAALWNLIPLVRSISLGLSGLVPFNLAVSFAAIVLAVLVALPSRESVGFGAKLLAIPTGLGGGFGLLASAFWLQQWIDQPHLRQPSDLRDAVVASFTMERAVQNTVFSACTLLLAILVLFSRRKAAE